ARQNAAVSWNRQKETDVRPRGPAQPACLPGCRRDRSLGASPAVESYQVYATRGVALSLRSLIGGLSRKLDSRAGGPYRECYDPLTAKSAGPSARSEKTAVLAVLAATAIALTLASQRSWSGDEGLDLLAAALINAGKRPYIDFFYQHLPFQAWLSAL